MIENFSQNLQEKILGIFSQNDKEKIKEYFGNFGQKCNWLKRLENLKKLQKLKKIETDKKSQKSLRIQREIFFLEIEKIDPIFKPYLHLLKDLKINFLDNLITGITGSILSQN